MKRVTLTGSLLVTLTLTACSSTPSEGGVPVGCDSAKATALGGADAGRSLNVVVGRVGVAQRWDVPRTVGRLVVYTGSAAPTPAFTSEVYRLGLREVAGDAHGWHVLSGEDDALRDAAAELVSNGAARYAQPAYRYRPSALPIPNDPLFAQQRPALDRLGIPAAWGKLDAGCAPVTVGVLDSGVSTDDPQLTPNLTPTASWATVTFDTLKQGTAALDLTNKDKTQAWHGHAVAATIAQVTGNAASGVGAGGNVVRVLPVNVLSRGADGTYGYEEGSVARGLEYAVGRTTVVRDSVTTTYVNPAPVRVINLSLGVGTSAWQGDDLWLQSYLDAARRAGVVIVAAAGNDSRDLVDQPAQSSAVIAVGSVSGTGARSTFSNYGRGLDFVAPGENILTRSSGTDTSWSGTSFAAPMFASQVALWMYANEQHRGSATAGRSGADVTAFLMACFAAASSNHAAWSAGAWGSGWTAAIGAGWVDTSAVVDATFTPCR